jgi:ABC-type nitrate/sulfonate/bicarbonate transport system substrate-binding protein
MDKLRINTFGRSAPHDAATSGGFYRAEDLEVEFAVTQSSKAQMQELLDGVWDVVHTNADNVFWWKEDNGADLLIILATPGKPNQDFVVRPEIQTYADLQGEVLAVDAAESGYATPLRLLLRQAGLTKEGRDYAFVEFGATQQRIDALRTRKAMGAMVGSNQSAALAADGFRVLDTINRLFTHYAGAAAVRRQWAQGHGELLVRYLRSHLRGALTEAGDAPKPPPFDWAGLQEMLELRQSVGLLRGPADPRPFADDGYYREAVASLT